MSNFDELPRRDRNHEIEGKAIAAFQMRLTESGSFLLQAQDTKDYGTDCQIEVMTDGYATNVRLHVQLKGTESALNVDGSLRIKVHRTNLNYLLMQPYSFYVAYHVPTGSLRIRTVESIVRQYKCSETNWTEQQSLTVSFVDELTVERLGQLGNLACAEAKSLRDRRLDQVNVTALSSHVLDVAPDIHVPEEPVLAQKLLLLLYEKNADETISSGFDKFAAVLGADNEKMSFCYMSEINLAMDGIRRNPNRIKSAIIFFQNRLVSERYHVGSLYYTIGNAYSALRDEEEAKLAFEAALTDPALDALPELAAQVHKNLGSSYELLGNKEQAVEHYHEALLLNPALAEAHNALGIHYVRSGNYENALHHFDQVVFSDQMRWRAFAVSGWRANVLFNLGDGRAAFREITALMAQADRLPWIWPWCCRLIASFGRANVDNARQALSFWKRRIKANPKDSEARWEILMANFYLRGQGENIAKSYTEFREEFDCHIALVEAKNAALPWDRLGHWAQDEEDWTEAERCFRKAYELAGGDYGYCLAIALKELHRFEESVPLLLEQAQTIQPDALSWFNLAAAYASLDRWSEAIDAYEKSLAIDPSDAVTIFDLGGAYWNSGNVVIAIEIWQTALERFPEHELSLRLRCDWPFLFGAG